MGKHLTVILFYLCLVISPALTQTSEDTEWFLGDWVVHSLLEDDPFMAAVTVEATDKPNAFTAEILAEDWCCDGEHYWKVREISFILVTGDTVRAFTRIEEFIEQPPEETNLRYFKDDFKLTRQEDGSLKGFETRTMTPVLWTRPQGPLV